MAEESSVPPIRRLPDKPRSVSAVRCSQSRVKLVWNQPLHNPHVVEQYVVHQRTKGRNWQEAARTDSNATSVVVYHLKPNTRYEFQVTAVNEMAASPGVTTTATTGVTIAQLTAIGACAGALSSLGLPYVIGYTHQQYKHHGTEISDFKDRALKWLSVAALPVSIALIPISAPALTMAMAMALRKEGIKEHDSITED